jgi:uncharacterized membrane protein YvlD (DUF360 family)
MTSLLIKVIVFPIFMIVFSYIMQGMDFTTLYQAIAAGLVLALVATGMEYMITIKSTLWLSVAADFILFLLIIESLNTFPSIHVTFPTAVLSSVLLSAIEYFIHLFLIKSGRTTRTVS